MSLRREQVNQMFLVIVTKKINQSEVNERGSNWIES